MLDLPNIHVYLEKHLSYKRYTHSKNVANVAEALARHYGCDERKAKLAGLVHDCSKEEKYDDLAYYARKSGFPVDQESYRIPEVLHGPASVYVSKTVFGINDEEILSAVRYHVTGRENMTLMEKIVFIADYIEPSRKFKGIEEVRALAYNDLNGAMIYALDLTILYIIERKGLLHHDTVSARNYLIGSVTQI